MRQKPCDTHRLIIWACLAISLSVVALIGVLLTKDKGVPSEAWMIVGSSLTLFGSIYQGRSIQPQNNSGVIVNEKENKDEQN